MAFACVHCTVTENYFLHCPKNNKLFIKSPNAIFSCRGFEFLFSLGWVALPSSVRLMLNFFRSSKFACSKLALM